MIPFYPKELLFFPHIKLYNDQNPEKFTEFEKTNIIKNDIYTSHENSEFDDNLFDDDPFCNDEYCQSTIFDNFSCKSTKLNNDHYCHPRSKSDFDILFYGTSFSKFQCFNIFAEMFDLGDNHTVYDCPTSFADQSISSLHFNQSETSNRNTRSKKDFRPLPRKDFCLFIPSPSYSRKLN